MNIINMGQAAKKAARALAIASSDEKNHALRCMANAILQHADAILAANEKDLALAKQKNVTPAFLDRLALDNKRITAMANAINIIADLPDPVGRILETIVRPNQLSIERISVPIGVIGVIYESRPNVTADAASLCLKAGNAVILRCGSESLHSSAAIIAALHKGIEQTNLPTTIVQILATNDRSAIDEMLKLDKYIDVLIPRGGMQLIEYVAANSRIPVFKHLAGMCHTYVHQHANKDMARKVILNAKMRRTGICGATEVLLIDKAIAQAFLPDILADLQQAGCEIRGDKEVSSFKSTIKQANDNDFDTEFLDAIIAVKIVADINEAITHIAEHGTQHTDAIITDDTAAFEKFAREVDSAIIMHNTSTQFADGGEFGMGGEIGIATGKLHARGPVGVNQLTTFKYVVHGNGQVRA